MEEELFGLFFNGCSWLNYPDLFAFYELEVGLYIDNRHIIMTESLELLLTKQSLNREEGARLSDAWLPACELFKGTLATGPA